MSGAAWNPKNKTDEELWNELVIMKNEYYDLDVEPTLTEFKLQEWNKLETKPDGMAATWAWNIKIDKEYKKKFKSV